MLLNNYETIVFDCDGVVLDSNKVKTKAFYEAALPYGKDAAIALVDYHVKNGGVSRYKKFAHFVTSIIPSDVKGPDIDSLLKKYAELVWQGLLSCEIAPGLSSLREETRHANWVIVSGGDQAELRELFCKRKISDLFDGGIFGSPDNKSEILRREIASGNISRKSILIGDSRYDFQAASEASLDFIFCKGWSEVKDPAEWLPNDVRIINSVRDLLHNQPDTIW